MANDPNNNDSNTGNIYLKHIVNIRTPVYCSSAMIIVRFNTRRLDQ